MDFAYSPSTGNATFPTWAESFSAPSVTPLTSSPASTGGGSNIAQWGEGIAAVLQGAGDLWRGFTGQPIQPGGILQTIREREQRNAEMQQLKDLFASMGLNAPTLVKPKTEDDKEENEEDDEAENLTSIEEIDKNAFKMPFDVSGLDFSRTDSFFDSEPGAWGSSSSFPSPRLAGQALSGYFNTGN